MSVELELRVLKLGRTVVFWCSQEHGGTENAENAENAENDKS